MTNNTQQMPPEEKPREMTLLELKTKVVAELRELLMRPLMAERILKMVGNDESKVARYMTSWFSILMQDDGSGKGDNKKYYVQCSRTSLLTCFLESVNMQLPFDSRKLVSMIIYDWEVELDISYKGFVNALNRHFTDAFVECKLVFEEDIFEVEIEDRRAHYKYKPKNPLANIDKDFTGIKGGYCFFSYTDKDSSKTSRLVFLSKEQILKNRSRAKQFYVWDSDPKAMGEKTCIREGARLPFASIDLEVDIEEIDNKHYQLDKPDPMLRLKNLMEAQEAEANDKKKEDDKPVESTPETVGNTDKPAEGSPADAQPITADPVSGPADQISKEIAPTGNAGGEALVKENPAPIRGPAKGQIIEGEFSNVAAGDAPKWDGETVYLGNGKTVKRDSFATSQQAAIYLKKVVNNRTKKETRREIMEGNSLLLAALQADGNTAIIEELHQLVEDGADDAKK